MPIHVRATPQVFALRPATTAVLVVDMQNDFVSPGGMFDRAGIDTTGVRSIVPKIQAVLRAAHDTGMTVVYLPLDPIMRHRYSRWSCCSQASLNR